MDDSISQGLSIGAIAIGIYLMTFMGLSTLIVIPLVLVLSGLVLQRYIGGKIEQDPLLSEGELKDVMYFTLISVAGIGLGSLLIPNLFQPKLPLDVTLSVGDQMLWGIMYGVSEERFFRGFISPFLLWKFGMPMPANLGSGAMFALYHMSVYGSSTDKMMYVFIAGAILSYATLASRRVSCSMLGHSINNIMAAM